MNTTLPVAWEMHCDKMPSAWRAPTGVTWHLLDMRLEDDYDTKDLSGLDLVKDLFPLPAIVVSGYGSYKIAGEAIRNAGAKDFVGKESRPEGAARSH